MSLVCGVDCSSLRRPNWIAWLDDSRFTLDAYVPSEREPLPKLRVRPGRVACIAFDAPQGLPRPGAVVRDADSQANTPTRRLPRNRHELETFRLYRGLIEVGINIFWWARSTDRARVFGLDGPDDAPTIAETYPRYVIQRMIPEIAIPSKRNAPIEYVDIIYGELQRRGFLCPSVVRPSCDQVDAMLCAVAARAVVESGKPPEGTVGAAPIVDDNAKILREGYIVAP